MATAAGKHCGTTGLIVALLLSILLFVSFVMTRKEGFTSGGMSFDPAWSADAAGWQPRVALIHNEREPEQNQLAWSPETMRAPYRHTT